MLFHTIEFFILFALTLFLRSLLPKKLEKLILLIASYLFYGWWSFKFIFLLWITTLIDFYAGKYIYKYKDNKIVCNSLLGLSLFINLGILFIFKYYIWVSELFGHDLGYTLILPLGISFYTFQSMSYTIDIYRGEIKAEKNLLSFALYVCFLPQLVAGPIERAGTLLKQINSGPQYIQAFWTSGISIFTWGMVKKVVFADHLGGYVEEIYSIHNDASSLDLLMASYAFALQIYCDFSGYTDMARGIARVMGYELHKNFDSPYFAQNIRDFWQKWHMTLSTWFRDYVYIPLGGNRKGEVKEYFNIFVTMLIAGLWHGANLTFVAWGALHGFMIMAYHFIHKQTQSNNILNSQSLIARIIKILVTFHLVLIGWIFFRSQSINQALEILNSIFFKGDWSVIRWQYVFALMIIFVVLIFVRRYFNAIDLICKNRYINWVFIWLGILSVIVFGALKKMDFIYFQF